MSVGNAGRGGTSEGAGAGRPEVGQMALVDSKYACVWDGLKEVEP